MKSKLDGVGVAHADQHSTRQLRTLMVEAEHAPMLESISSGLVAVGLTLYARIGAGEIHYWTDISPATLVVALGMG